MLENVLMEIWEETDLSLKEHGLIEDDGEGNR